MLWVSVTPRPTPTMRSVAIKSPEQQTVLMLHRTRERLGRRTMLVKARRAPGSGLISPQGLPSMPTLIEGAERAGGTTLP